MSATHYVIKLMGMIGMVTLATRYTKEQQRSLSETGGLPDTPQ
jgi:hypothetical protein